MRYWRCDCRGNSSQHLHSFSLCSFERAGRGSGLLATDKDHLGNQERSFHCLPAPFVRHVASSSAEKRIYIHNWKHLSSLCHSIASVASIDTEPSKAKPTRPPTLAQALTVNTTPQLLQQPIEPFISYPLPNPSPLRRGKRLLKPSQGAPKLRIPSPQPQAKDFKAMTDPHPPCPRAKPWRNLEESFAEAQTRRQRVRGTLLQERERVAGK